MKNNFGLKEIAETNVGSIEIYSQHKADGLFEYYYRRGNKYFFRNEDQKVSMELPDPVNLQRGKSYNMQLR